MREPSQTPGFHPKAGPDSKPLGASLGWQLRGSRYIYQSQWYDLRQDELTLPGGQPATFTYVEHPGFVSVVALTAATEVLLIRNYRYTVDRWVWEVPAGGKGNRPDLSAEALAVAELREETGYAAEGPMERVARQLCAIGNSHTEADVFYCPLAAPTGAQDLEDTEQIEVWPTSIRETLRMLRAGEIEDGSSALALFLCLDRLEAAAGL